MAETTAERGEGDAGAGGVDGPLSPGPRRGGTAAAGGAGSGPPETPGKDQNMGEAAELLLGITGKPEGAAAAGAGGAEGDGAGPAKTNGSGGAGVARPATEAKVGGSGADGGTPAPGGGSDDDDDIVSSGTPFEPKPLQAVLDKEHRIEKVPVSCNNEKGVYHVAEQMIEWNGKMMPPQKFEKVAGKGGSRKWRFSIKYMDPRGEEFPLGVWLQHQIKNDVKLARPESVDEKQKDFIQWSGDSVEITCNKNPALFELASKTVIYEGNRLPPLRFETMSGKGRFRNWKRSFIVKETGQPLGVWLKARGIVFGRTKEIDVQNDQLRAEINQKNRQKEVEDAMVALAAIKEDPKAKAKAPAGTGTSAKKKTSKKKKKKKKQKKKELDNGGTIESTATCTVCSKAFPPCDTMSHPYLGTLVCGRCHSEVATTSFQTGEDGNEDFCRWCAAGGDWAFCCDFCTASFCKKCVENNLGAKELERISNAEKWHCYLCNSSPLKAAREISARYFNWAKKGRLRNIENTNVPTGVAPLRAIGPASCPVAGSGRSATAAVPEKPMIEWSRGQYYKAEVVTQEPLRVLVRFTEKPEIEPEYLLRCDSRIWSGSLDDSSWHTLNDHFWEPIEAGDEKAAAVPFSSSGGGSGAGGSKRPRQALDGELPESVDVKCNGRHGKFVVASQAVLCDGQELHPADFEKLAGKGPARKWRATIVAIEAGGSSTVPLGQWLDTHGIRLPALQDSKPGGAGVGLQWNAKPPPSKRGRPAKKGGATPAAAAGSEHAPLPILPFLSDAAALCWQEEDEA